MPAKASSPGPSRRRLKRFRVHLVQRHFHHLDVVARSKGEADRIALQSSEWWIDDDRDSVVDVTRPVAGDDPGFSPPEATCQTCGQTLSWEEDRDARICDACRSRSRAEHHDQAA